MSGWAIAPMMPTIIVARPTHMSRVSRLPLVKTTERMRMMA